MAKPGWLFFATDLAVKDLQREELAEMKARFFDSGGTIQKCDPGDCSPRGRTPLPIATYYERDPAIWIQGSLEDDYSEESFP